MPEEKVQNPKTQEKIIDIYRKRAKGTDTSGISSFGTWRKEAIRKLNLRRGDLVVDMGCGTGLNFALLQEAIGPEGKLIGVDLTDAMLDQAQQRVAKHGWKNVELVQSDATQYKFPTQVGGIISTFALTFIPEAGRVIQQGRNALAPARMWVVLDMAWPAGWLLGLRPLLFFLPRYGITAEVIKRRPWETIIQTMEQQLGEVERKQFWFGFFYLVSGRQAH